MRDLKPLLDRIVARWDDLVRNAVVEAASSSSTSNYYAAGFWLFYVDYTVFGVPCLALNSEENLASSDPTCRWCPSEWLVDVHSCHESIQPLYTELSKLLAGESDESWELAVDQHYDAMCYLCKSLTANYHAGDGAFGMITRNPQFVVGIFEEREGDELYKTLVDASIEPDRRASLDGL